MYSFCTYFDKNFLPQGLSLIESIKNKCTSEFSIYILCLDELTFNILENLKIPNVILLKEEDLIKYYPKLKDIKGTRSNTEYYYCFTPILISYVIFLNNNCDSCTYIDADIYFFQNFIFELEKRNNYDILIFEHGTPITPARNLSGIYNVGFNFFRNTSNSKEALTWWTTKVIESTGRGPGVWGDQKYLESFPSKFKKVGIINELKLIAAPWNIMNGKVLLDSNNNPQINGENIVMYHYARLLVYNENIFLPIKTTKLSDDVLNFIYRPYMQSINRSVKKIKEISPNYKISYTKKNLKGLIGSLFLGRFFKLKGKEIKRIGIDLPVMYK